MASSPRNVRGRDTGPSSPAQRRACLTLEDLAVLSGSSLALEVLRRRGSLRLQHRRQRPRPRLPRSACRGAARPQPAGQPHVLQLIVQLE
eukprot:759185-Hanusia_phi.AAC.1